MRPGPRRGLLASTGDGRGVTDGYAYDTVGRRTGIEYLGGTDTKL